LVTTRFFVIAATAIALASAYADRAAAAMGHPGDD
jgi:hypothetical protein